MWGAEIALPGSFLCSPRGWYLAPAFPTAPSTGIRFFFTAVNKSRCGCLSGMDLCFFSGGSSGTAMTWLRGPTRGERWLISAPRFGRGLRGGPVAPLQPSLAARWNPLASTVVAAENFVLVDRNPGPCRSEHCVFVTRTMFPSRDSSPPRPNLRCHRLHPLFRLTSVATGRIRVTVAV